MGFKVGICLSSVGIPLSRAIAQAVRLGADGLELDARRSLTPRELGNTARRQLRRMFEEANLKVSCVAFTTRRGYDVPDDLERRVAATKEAMTFAYDLGCSTVVNGIGRIPESIESMEWQRLRETMTDIGRHAQRCGAFLCARTGSESASQLSALIRSLPEGSLGVDFDPGSRVIHGFSANDGLSELAPWIMHVHARDAVRDLAIGRGLEVTLGRGSVDFPTLVATLGQQGYHGFLTIDRRDSNNVLEEMKDAVAYLKELRSD
jgi:sugar phosphate isomerase/epimerase